MLDCQIHCIPNWVVLLDPTLLEFDIRKLFVFASHAKKKSGKPWRGYIREFSETVLCPMIFCEGCDCCIFSAEIKFVNLAQMFQTVFLNAL